MEEVYLNASSSGELSPEDISWVDSCLVKDADIPESNWDSLKDALMDIISAQADTCAITSEDEKRGSDIEITSGETKEVANHDKPTNHDDRVSLNEEPDTSKDDTAGDERKDAVPLSVSQVNPFRPTYSEDAKESELGVDSGSSSYEFDPRSHDIFRVWELNVPSEVDELVKQCKTTLPVSLSEAIPTREDSVEWNDLKDLQGGLPDELTAGMADLSLSRD